jgi:hypothetical protein
MARNWIARNSRRLKPRQDDSRRARRNRSHVGIERLEGRIALSSYATGFVPAAVTVRMPGPDLAEKAPAQANVAPCCAGQHYGQVIVGPDIQGGHIGTSVALDTGGQYWARQN